MMLEPREGQSLRGTCLAPWVTSQAVLQVENFLWRGKDSSWGLGFFKAALSSSADVLPHPHRGDCDDFSAPLV